MTFVDLRHIHRLALARCAPDVLVRQHVRADMPHHVVAIGKGAGALLDGVAAVHRVDSAFVAIPEGYRLPSASANVYVGGHPHITRASFAAGRALLDYVDAHDDILFLISGGGSACVEVALPPFTEGEITDANARLIRSDLAIGAINAERRRMSAIKGGKLAARVRGRAVTLVYSDVSTGALHDVASGPTLPGSSPILVADNTTLVRAVAEILGDAAVTIEKQIEGDVGDAARLLAARARALKSGQILVAGGEPVVAVRGGGRGGRCSELAVRFGLECGFPALFAGSDGVDGNSGAAGFVLPRRAPGAPAGWQSALERSDSYSVALQMGEPIMIAPTGSNLRDLFLVACL